VIPLRLRISGFLSYCEPVEVDFSGFDLACISGQNGAGKSSLLDAMTWVLFGQARKRDESIVNLQSKTAEVAFTFAYESNQFRVIRSLVRGKNVTLEFQISDDGNWRPLTEHSNRETQARIEQVLRLDYDTFINVSFFLQGRADQFAQQPPTRRKEILGNILGLEIWEVFKARSVDRRKVVENDLGAVEGRMSEIDTELAEAEPRKIHLADLESQLIGFVASRKMQEETLASIRQLRTGLDKQQELVQKMAQALHRSLENLSTLQTRLVEKETERQPHAVLLGHASEIEAAYAIWQHARQDLEMWEGAASKFREQEKHRLPFLDEINFQKAKLEQEKETLEAQGALTSQQSAIIIENIADLATAKKALVEAETKLEELSKLEKQVQAGRERQAELRTENASLKIEMDNLSFRIKKLEAAEGVSCPLCGQPLSPDHRQSTLEQLQSEGKQKGDIWRSNKVLMDDLANRDMDFEKQILNYSKTDTDRLSLSNTVALLTERLEMNQQQTREWETIGAMRLEKVKKKLDNQEFALEARKKLAKVDKELATLGYETAAHDSARRAEIQGRPAETSLRALESARSALKPLEDEIANLSSQLATLSTEITNQQTEHQSAIAALAAMEAQAPDLDDAERNLFDSQERENQLNQEVGAARQKVTVLDDLRKRRIRLEVERGELGLRVGQFKALERAFGKDGVPALLIEQALPEIELKANEILGRLSDDTMRLHIETQAKYKDEKRKDLRETLEIQVSDGAGERDYELFSGGEAFRVNFAIRLALSEVLAQRKGARLQMLVIDEGFGSQDALGRQRLIQAINAVRGDFAKILVITHLDELKDAFPTRIEVVKTDTGSSVTVI
jgi:exonuclease SbcC